MRGTTVCCDCLERVIRIRASFRRLHSNPVDATHKYAKARSTAHAQQMSSACTAINAVRIVAVRDARAAKQCGALAQMRLRRGWCGSC
jgi:hypothetical protein